MRVTTIFTGTCRGSEIQRLEHADNSSIDTSSKIPEVVHLVEPITIQASHRTSDGRNHKTCSAPKYPFVKAARWCQLPNFQIAARKDQKEVSFIEHTSWQNSCSIHDLRNRSKVFRRLRFQISLPRRDNLSLPVLQRACSFVAADA